MPRKKADPVEQLSVEQWEIKRLIPYDRNPRVLTEDAIAKVAASIKEYGWRQPIVVDGDGVVIVGHTRLEAAKRLGHKTVPVDVAGNMSQGQVRAYRIADNRVGEYTSWDDDKLTAEIMDLAEMNIELTPLGFHDEELLAFLASCDDEQEADGEEYDGHQYTRKIEAPLYEPKGEKPEVSELVDRSKVEALLEEIHDADLPPEVAEFMMFAAERHAKFNFSAIANYYAHASGDVQDLMERSALVIIDFDKAMENGFVSLTERFDKQFREDYASELEAGEIPADA